MIRRVAPYCVFAVVMSLVGACGTTPPGPRDGGAGGGSAAVDGSLAHDGGSGGGGGGGGSPDASVTDSGTTFDAGVGPFDAGTEPTTAIRPVPGEVTMIQLDIPATITFPPTTPTGESAIIVGPDGTVVLIDAGNTMHADFVRNAIKALNTNDLTVARGFPSARDALQVDWLIITHLHSDHMASLGGGLLTGNEALKITKGIVYRGFVDLGSSLSLSKGKTSHAHFDSFCPLTRGAYQLVDRPLCHSAETPPCVSANWVGHYEATDCNGLVQGDLSTAADDANHEPSYIDLGAGARITFWGANGHSYDPETKAIEKFTPAWGYDDNDQENARSLMGVVSHGPFRFVFAGDMSGAGSSDAPDIESFMVAHAGKSWAPLGADVSHANHHARKTSSGPNYVASLAPKDGQQRNVTAGINEAYTGLPGTASPSSDALAAWLGDNRLAGGNFWVTGTAILNVGSDPAMINAKSAVTYQTIQGGLGYRLQTAASLTTKSFISVRH